MVSTKHERIILSIPSIIYTSITCSFIYRHNTKHYVELLVERLWSCLLGHCNVLILFFSTCSSVDFLLFLGFLVKAENNLEPDSKMSTKCMSLGRLPLLYFLSFNYHKKKKVKLSEFKMAQSSSVAILYISLSLWTLPSWQLSIWCTYETKL